MPCPSRVLKQQSDRLPAGKILPIRGKGLPLLGGNGKRTAFPPPLRDAATRTSAARKTAGLHPPGAGRALAGGFRPPAGPGSAWRCGRGDGPCQDAQGAHRRKRFPPCAQAAHQVGTFSACCQVRHALPGRRVAIGLILPGLCRWARVKRWTVSGGFRPGSACCRGWSVAAVSPAVALAQIASGGDGSGDFRFPAEGLPRHLPEIRPGCHITGQIPVRAWRQARAGHRGPSRSGQARGPAATGSPVWSPGPASGHRSATGRQRRQAWCRDR